MSGAAREKLAFAADLPLEDALGVYRKIRDHIGTVKVGLSLFVEHGPSAVQRFLDEGAQVFLDLKLHDIPNTVELAAQQVGALGVSFLTVHAQGGTAMVQAALRGAEAGASKTGKVAPRILAVTVLTALSEADVRDTGHHELPDALVCRLGKLAHRAGAQGLVCSPHEARSLRLLLGADVFLCTPGIRPESADKQDQARAQTPTLAIEAGADLLVVGRPIYAAADPVQAAEKILQEISAA